jgi:hypothetical protein
VQVDGKYSEVAQGTIEIQNAQVSDTTKDDSSSVACKIKFRQLFKIKN